MQGPYLDQENAAFVQRGVSIVAASRDAALVPSIARATGCVVSSDRRQVAIFVIPSQSVQLLADVADSKRIAVVFSQPTTHRTLQLKADDARIRALREEERAVVARYVDAFATEIGRLGHTAAQAHIMFDRRDEDVVAIEFHPNAAFEQTPGPKAGSPLAVAR